MDGDGIIDERSGVRVIIDSFDGHPSCPHGPTILFERQTTKFYACSACRNRKDCPFYVLKESWINKKAINRFKELPQLQKFSYCGEFLKKITSVSPSQRGYCHTCSSLYLSSETSSTHIGHDTTPNINDSQLLSPSKLFKPLENNKKEAQYLFSDQALDVFIKVLQENKMKNVICLGTPRLHERIQGNPQYNIKSILLDIDGRHQMFYPSSKFIHYNIFNNHFFNGNEDKNIFESFLQNYGGSATCLVMDPPFGGRIEPLSHTLQTISKQSHILNNDAKNEIGLLPTILIMPYFMEPQIKNYIADLEMSDYQIGYENHSKFQVTQKTKQKCVVRMFTNIPLSKVILPKDEGYKYCKACFKWVGSWNKHCTQCKSCTSKNRTTYVHCNYCKKCVKPTWVHCSKCARCHMKEHLCGTLPNNQICFNCQESGHKKIDCPMFTSKRKNADDTDLEISQPKKKHCKDLTLSNKRSYVPSMTKKTKKKKNKMKI